jgi:hypothetical protein
LHVHEPGLGIVSHVAVVDDYGPIHSFKPPPEYPGRRQHVTA